MNRLKFRVWDEANKKLRYDVTGFEHGVDNEMVGVFLDGDYYSIDQQVIVMQSTGLYDKNSKEIYEGDILEFVYHEGTEKEKKYIKYVRYFLGMFEVRERLSDIIGESLGSNITRAMNPIYRVVGNVCENKEMIKC